MGRLGRLALAALALAASAAGRRVLVTTWGGSGATALVTALREAGYTTNSPTGTDFLKFAPVNRVESIAAPRHGKFCLRKQHGGHPGQRCFDRVLVVVREDPGRVIASLMERKAHELKTIRETLTRGCKHCRRKLPKAGRGREALQALFQLSGAKGKDVFGLSTYFESWARVVQSHALMSTTTRYPPVLFVDADMLAAPDFQCFLYAFLDARDLKTQTTLSALLASGRADSVRGDPSKLMGPKAHQIYQDLRARAKELLDHSHAAVVTTFWNATKTCRYRDVEGPLATEALEPPPAVLKRRYKRAEPRKYRKVRKEDEVDPIDEIPDEEWDEILFSLLEQTAAEAEPV
mmetsp:Transcript_27682/g.83029  ORF Transcript_27682/g.83029 Transcript_27682/m.83029 type:complete len:348 (-) Transcript_27682:19-1062(-)